MKNTSTFWPTKGIDLIIAYSIIETFVNSNEGVLPFISIRNWDGLEKQTDGLPQWMLAMIAAFRNIHGEAYYAFALDNVTNELIAGWPKACQRNQQRILN